MFGLSKGLLVSLIAAFFGVGAAGYMAYRTLAVKPAVVASTPPQGATTPAVSPPATAPSPSSTAAAPAPAAPTQTAAAAPAPSFDIVRVEPSGEAVVAGRAAPNTQVVLTNKGEEIARAQADAKGEFVMLPPALAPGDHVLALGTPEAKATSTQNVTVSVPQQGAKDTLVALTEPDKPTRILSDTARPASAPAGDAASTVAIRSVEADEAGGFFASGSAQAGATIRLYLNEIMVATVQAGADRQWTLKIEKGMIPGAYRVRADMIDPATGTVQARAEAPFDYPERRVASAAAPLPPVRPTDLPGQTPSNPGAPSSAPAGSTQTATSAPPAQIASSPAASGPAPLARPPASPPGQIAAAAPAAQGRTQSAPANAVVSEIQSVTVIRGDNLWRISRKMLGRGMRYTQIYEANATQIRDPRLIYPKQIFVMPGAAN